MLPSSVTVAKPSGFKCGVLGECRGRSWTFSRCLVPIVLLNPGFFDSASSSLHHSESKMSWPSVCALLSQRKGSQSSQAWFCSSPTRWCPQTCHMSRISVFTPRVVFLAVDFESTLTLPLSLSSVRVFSRLALVAAKVYERVRVWERFKVSCPLLFFSFSYLIFKFGISCHHIGFREGWGSFDLLMVSGANTDSTATSLSHPEASIVPYPFIFFGFRSFSSCFSTWWDLFSIFIGMFKTNILISLLLLPPFHLIYFIWLFISCFFMWHISYPIFWFFKIIL